MNIIDGDSEDEAGPAQLFELGQQCDACGDEPGIIGLDPTCRGSYPGDPTIYGARCAPGALEEAFASIDGIAVIVEPFDDYGDLLYYRVDEMPAYQFVREDTEAISWLLLTIGDECARCGEQSRVALLARDAVDPRLPENQAVFRSPESTGEHLCGRCAGRAIATACLGLHLPLMTVELPRSAMGIMMPGGD